MADLNVLLIFVVNIVLLFSWINLSVSTSDSIWKKEEDFNGRAPTFGTLINTRSRLDCGKECSKDSSCVSFFFTPGIDNGCQLLDFILPSTEAGSITPTISTASYYVPDDPHIDNYIPTVLSDGTLLRYRIELTPLSHDQAEANCASDGGHLVQITSATKLTALRTTLVDNYGSSVLCINIPSAEYTGSYSTTLTGGTCLRWDVNNDYDYTDVDFPEATIGDAANYCRDPGGGGSLWCMANAPNGDTYEYCWVFNCGFDIEHQPPDICYHSGVSTEYMGTWSKTRQSTPCQRWDAQTPHAHAYTSDSMFPDGSVSAAANYCRDPGGLGYTWCYTTDAVIEWQSCHTLNCEQDAPERKCFDTANPWEYTGTWNLTSSGIVCKRWDADQDYYDGSDFPSQSLYDAHNYCRDPDQSGRLWCYTHDPAVSWEFCNIPKCDGSDGFHVQASNFVDVSTWQDLDGNTVEPSAWANDKPDYPDVERCARMDRKYDWFINDGSCSWSLWFICEK